MSVHAFDTYHPGNIESRHAPINDATKDYSTNNGYCQIWANKVEQGDFITCGTTGNAPFCYVNGLRKSKMCYSQNFDGHKCCTFVTGEACYNKKLKRRWSCCGRAAQEACVMDDMRWIEGCTPVYNLPNVTPRK